MNSQRSVRLEVTPAFIFCMLLSAAISGLVAYSYFFPPTSTAREVPVSCESNLEGIARAIHCYQTTHGELPPHEVLHNGHKHGWRAAIADFLTGESSVWKSGYDFGASWDSDSNRSSMRSFSPFFNCTEENTALGYPYTSFVMLLRRSADNTFISPNELRPKAVLIVESSDSRIETGEPRDLKVADLFDGNGPFGPGRLNSRHEYHVNAMCVDGSVINIPKTISENELKKLLAGE
ncbi:MAG: DUF1559 domain-containing protein [Pirellulales bacterium]|nr:DUF1559 domain-containing protein [Pirellulales bacterium]